MEKKNGVNPDWWDHLGQNGRNRVLQKSGTYMLVCILGWWEEE